MQPSLNAEQQTTVQILTELLSLVNQNVPTWVDLFAEDAVFESPYAPGTPERVEGKIAVFNFIKNALAQMQGLRFSNIRAYPTTNPMFSGLSFMKKPSLLP